MTVQEQRDGERARYLKVNLATHPDARDRWYKYEDLILVKYGPARFYPRMSRAQRLDKAWEIRDKYHRAKSRPNNGQPVRQGANSSAEFVYPVRASKGEPARC